MWICLYDCFFSIVAKDCKPSELLVRARRKGDIEKVFKDAKVTRYTKSDYLYRAVVPKADVIAAMSIEIEDISYPNFKNSVSDKELHAAYERCWYELAKLQPLPPYSGFDKKKRAS